MIFDNVYNFYWLPWQYNSAIFINNSFQPEEWSGACESNNPAETDCDRCVCVDRDCWESSGWEPRLDVSYKWNVTYNDITGNDVYMYQTGVKHLSTCAALGTIIQMLESAFKHLVSLNISVYLCISISIN